ncbi:sulfite exporter TauE/SafE family protein [Comamonas sp. GB3 AK4-5]|uniref:sulfite exporter TauE/SafE family protein n=1 Tax=Comamonas sp. GB3 AK4-5 TaxID=3231487 RepID=UPI00351F0777
MDYSATAYICIFLAAILIGFSKTSVGGLVILAVPLVAIGFPGKQSTGIILPLMVFADLLAVLYYRRDCDWRVILKFFPLTAAGVGIGYLILDAIPNKVFDLVLGVTIIVMLLTGMVVERVKLGQIAQWSYTIVVGLLVGVATMLANAAGPLLGIYFLQLGMDKKGFIGTRSWYFLLLNAFKLPFSASIGLITADSLILNVMCIPLALLGGYIGYRLIGILNENIFKRCIQGAALIAAAQLIYSGIR